MAMTGVRVFHDLPPQRVRYRSYVRLPLPVWGLILLAAFLLSLPSLDPALNFACIVTLPLLATLVWRVSEPPVAFAAVTAQWLQVSVGTFRATQNGVSLNDLFHTGGAGYATWLSLAGLLILALGIRMANLGRPPMNTEALHAELHSYRYSRVVVTYCLAQAANLSFGGVIWIIPGLAQPLLAASQLRWLFYFILAVTTLVQKRGYVFLIAATAFEIVLGFASFFSDFKTVFFVFAVSYLMVQRRLSARMIVSLTVLFGVLFYMAVIWSAVKMQYRDYQNQGTGAQVSLVGTIDKLEELADLVSKVDSDRFLQGIDLLTERVEYTRFFGYVTENVPGYLPYQEGGIWGAALYHVLTPRLFFPDKAELVADIENTRKYTGIAFAGGGNDTEIPLGYMADSYIDFGPVGMYVPIFLLGLLLGYEYRYFATRRTYLVFAYGLTPVVFATAIGYEETSVKLLGGNLIVFIVAVLACKFAFPILQRQLIRQRPVA